MTKVSKLGLGAGGIVVVAAIAAGGAQIWAQHTARDRVDAALASLPAGESGHYDQLHYNLFNQRLHLTGLTITRGGQTTFSAARVTVVNASGAGTTADPFKAAELRVTDIAAQRNGHHITLDLVTAEDVALLGADVAPPSGLPIWPAMPEGDTLLSARKISASGIHDDTGGSVAQLDVSDYNLGHFRYGFLAGFADSKGNRVASAAAEQIDLDGLDRLFDARRYDAGAQGWPARRPLIGHLAIKGIQIADRDQGTADIADIGIDGFSGRPFATAPGESDPTGAALQDAAEAVALEGLTLQGVAIKAPKDSLAFSLQRLALTGYADGVLGRIGFDGLTLQDTKDRSMALAHFALRGIDAAALLKLPPDTSSTDVILKAGNGGVRLDGMDLAGLKVSSAPGVRVSMDSLQETVGNSTPLRVEATLRGLSLPAAALQEAEAPLKSIGIDPLVLDADEVWVTDMAKHEATIEQGRIAARGLATLDVTGQFTNLPIGTTDIGEALAQLEKVATTKFTIRFTNDSLVQRIVALEAKNESKTENEVRDEAKLVATATIAAFLPQQKDAADHIAAFIDNPKSLTITANPAAPVVLSTLMGSDGPAAQQALNLHVTGN
jgi:hypothetical protein